LYLRNFLNSPPTGRQEDPVVNRRNSFRSFLS